jgi:hypothetical protein
VPASDHLHPEQLRNLANQHGDTHFPNFRDPDKRETSRCYDYSEHFSRHCAQANAKVQPYSFDDDDAHAANLVSTSKGPYIVDFTYNQFDRNAKVPIVEPRHQYEKRFKGREVETYPPYKHEGDITLD